MSKNLKKIGFGIPLFLIGALGLVIMTKRGPAEKGAVLSRKQLIDAKRSCERIWDEANAPNRESFYFGKNPSGEWKPLAKDAPEDEPNEIATVLLESKRPIGLTLSIGDMGAGDQTSYHIYCYSPTGRLTTYVSDFRTFHGHVRAVDTVVILPLKEAPQSMREYYDLQSKRPLDAEPSDWNDNSEDLSALFPDSQALITVFPLIRGHSPISRQ